MFGTLKSHGDLKAKLEALSRSLATIEFAPDGTILDANENFLAAMGYARAEVIGQHHRLFVDPAEAASPAYAAFWETLRAGRFQAVEAIDPGAVAGHAPERLEVQRLPAADEFPGEGIAFRGLTVGVGVQPADVGQPRVVVREQVPAELTGHGGPLPRRVDATGSTGRLLRTPSW